MSNSTNAKQIDFGKGYSLLVSAAKKNKPRPEVINGKLRLAEIKFATSVFQPRTGEGTQAEAAAHISALAEAIRNSPNHVLDPILVWWSGNDWRVVDGHHRLIAYQQVSNPLQPKAHKRCIPIDAVPVEVFDGDLKGALKEATARNVKDKLKMTKRDKLERAWKFTALGTMTIPEIAAVTGVAERTVGTMRKAIAELSAEDAGSFGPDVNVLNITWEEAKKRQLAERPIDDEWIDKQAKDWARRLAHAFGEKLARNPSITLKALERYSEKLPDRLMQLWQDDAGTNDEE
ncbi:MAG: ParB N-terminal domain-containing protein [Rhizobiales bacterium]|nr:ParB N-terminal domain-containing protein [Hyphomicrobiales bacterium]